MSESENKSTQWSLVLNNPLENSSGLSCKKILQTLNGIYPFIAVILHDQDINDDGQLKTAHFHLILESKRTRKSTLLKQISDLLDLPLNCISCKEIINWRKAVRYITHIDYEDKTYYLPSDIYTNDRIYLDSFFASREENICEEKLIEIVRYEKTTAKILLKIGMENYKKYAQIIRDLQRNIV